MPTPIKNLILLRSLPLILPLIWPNLPAQSLASRLNKAPAGVEEALRDRVTGFFGLQSEGKFRQGESFVCDESKDAYYDSFKTRWTSVAIVSITWEDSFQTGKVLMSLGTELKTLGGSIPAKYPMASVWKVQKNEWCYYLPPAGTAQIMTPFGALKPGPPSKGGDAALNPTAPPTAAEIAGMIRISKKELIVKANEESTDSLEVENGLPGSVRLIIHAPEMPGLKWTLSQTELKQRDKAILNVVYKPVDQSAKPPFNLNLLVEPFGSMNTITVIFAPPPMTPAPAGQPLPKH